MTRPGVQDRTRLCQSNKSKFCVEPLTQTHKKIILKLWAVDILLPDHVGLPHVLDLEVHLVHLPPGWVWGVILRLFPQSTSSWLKVVGWWGEWRM